MSNLRSSCQHSSVDWPFSPVRAVMFSVPGTLDSGIVAYARSGYTVSVDNMDRNRFMMFRRLQIGIRIYDYCLK